MKSLFLVLALSVPVALFVGSASAVEPKTSSDGFFL